MTKKTINSFKELPGLITNVELVKESPPKKSTTKSASKKSTIANAKSKGPNKPLEKAHRKINIPLKPVDPKLQVIFDSLKWLKDTFPKAFVNSTTKVTALKIGIGQDIIEYVKSKADVPHSLTSIRKALSLYTHNFRYLSASAKVGNPRIDLTGTVVGQISEEQANYAQEKLNALKQKQKERKSKPEVTTKLTDAISETKPGS
jgi:ProP effector